MSKVDRRRRRLLRAPLGAGLALALPLGAADGNIRELSGGVFINQGRAGPGSVIRPGDRVSTSRNGRVEFVVDGDAFLVKEFSSLEVGEPGNPLIDALQLLTGKLLGVFAPGRPRRIVTANATIGIRGTGCFLNARPDSLYYCNCYGRTELISGGHREVFEATRHSAHVIDFASGDMLGMRIARVIDHNDDELRRLEAYLDRVPPFDRL